MKSLALLLAVIALTACGCATKTSVPRKMAIWDVGSGIRFTTYTDLATAHIFGVSFDDLETGDRVTLTSFRVHTVTEAGSYKKDAPEVMQYEADLNSLITKQTTPAPAAAVDTAGTFRPRR